MRTIKMTAKKTGTCRNCNQPISIGQSIYWTRGAGAVHCDCKTAAYQDSVCSACNGAGSTWNGTPCRSCDGTGARNVQEFARKTERHHVPDPVDLAYEDSCRDACGL
jgi:DnaJ-class molecular chaperone